MVNFKEKLEGGGELKCGNKFDFNGGREILLPARVDRSNINAFLRLRLS